MMLETAVQKKKAAELRAQQPTNVIPFQFYYNQRRDARLRVIASFTGTNKEFREYLRRGEVSCLL